MHENPNDTNADGFYIAFNFIQMKNTKWKFNCVHCYIKIWMLNAYFDCSKLEIDFFLSFFSFHAISKIIIFCIIRIYIYLYRFFFIWNADLTVVINERIFRFLNYYFFLNKLKGIADCLLITHLNVYDYVNKDYCCCLWWCRCYLCS